MNIIHDWREKLNKLWSVRIAILISLLAVSDELLYVVAPVVPPLAYAALSVVVILARIAYQPDMHTEKDE